MVDVRVIGVIVVFLGGAAVLTSLIGPQYPLMKTAAPSVAAWWPKARAAGTALILLGSVLVLMSWL